VSALFVTATGTGVGKTLVTESLVRLCRAAGRPVDALKPVISGFAPDSPAESDSGRLLAALGRPLDVPAISAISPWRFAAPLSPDMAAAREGRSIDFEALVSWCEARIAAASGLLLIEGVGGAMVPLDDRHTVRDWIQRLEIPALVIGGSYLGALSHALTTLEALRVACIPVSAMVISESEDAPVPAAETAASLARFTTTPIYTLPRRTPPDPASLSDLLAALP